MTSFNDLALEAPLQRALAQEGHTAPTPIQAQALPPAIAGKDILGIAQTGTGKTAAFMLPILNRLLTDKKRYHAKAPRALILAPTRELAVQITERAEAYGAAMSLRTSLVIGGVPVNRQRRALQNGVDILVATPGRLADLCSQGLCDLSHAEVLVLDEADQMLDMGFIHAVRRLKAMLPAERQTMLFSATMPKEIERFAAEMLTAPVRVEVTPVAKTADKVDQSVRFVPKSGKTEALADILSKPDVELALVFSRTKHGADKIVKALAARGIESAAIHGNKSQNARQRALGAFADRSMRVLVATDIAARGIDVTGISHVIQHDLPEVPETYVHRIGRTARAGATGQAIALCSADDVPLLRAVEKLTRQGVPIAAGSVSLEELGPPAPREKPQHRKGQNRQKPQARQKPAGVGRSRNAAAPKSGDGARPADPVRARGRRRRNQTAAKA